MREQIIKDRLILILQSIELIQKRINRIPDPKLFYSSDEGIELLDSIAMRLQQIGENIKKISEVRHDFFENQIILDPTPIIAFRDFISHHYEKTDAEIIYDICISDLPMLKEKITHFFGS